MAAGIFIAEALGFKRLVITMQEKFIQNGIAAHLALIAIHPVKLNGNRRCHVVEGERVHNL